MFDTLTIAGRLSPVETPDALVVDGPGVTFFPLPSYVGPRQFVTKRHALRDKLRELFAQNGESSVILRVPGVLGFSAYQEIKRLGRVCGLEVVGDPYDMFAPQSVNHPLRPFFRWWFPRSLRSLCKAAAATAYVTASALQERYPPAPGRFTTHYSSVELPEEAFVASPRTISDETKPLTLVTVASLEHMHKGIDLLIDALQICRSQGLTLRLKVVGDGKHRSTLQNRAVERGVQDQVEFVGRVLPGEAVRQQLDQADIFVLATRQEGLPRALIEAMARGLPSIASRVGGIPELLPAEDIFPANDLDALVRKIQDVAANAQRRLQMSSRGLAKAREYHATTLRTRRSEFYRYLRTQTEQQNAASNQQ